MKSTLLQWFLFLLLLAGRSGLVAAQNSQITVHDFIFDGYAQGSGYPVSKLNSGSYPVTFSAIVSKPSTVALPNRAYLDIKYDYNTTYGQVLYGPIPLSSGTVTTTTVNGVITDNIAITGTFQFDPNTIRSPRGGWYSLFAAVSYYVNPVDTDEVSRANPPVYFPAVISTQPGNPTNPPQQGAIADGNYLLRNRWSGQVLEIGGSDPMLEGAQANQWGSFGTLNQQWRVSFLGNNSYSIINSNSQKALEVYGGTKTQGDRIGQWTYHGGAGQRWVLRPVSGSSRFYTIANINSGMVLEIGGGYPYNTSSGALANQWPYYGAGTNHQEQEWELLALPTASPGVSFPYVYTLTNVNSNQVLEIGGSQPAPVTAGSKANQWPYTGTSNQHWTITEVGNGYYKIVNRNSGMALEIGGGAPYNTTQGSEANQWPYVNGTNQEWIITEVTPGVYSIINRNSNYALEIGGASTAPGATASQWTYFGGSNQHWYISQFAQNRTAAPQQQASTTAVPPVDEAAFSMSIFPNPTSGEAVISYSLPVAASVSIDITDSFGGRSLSVVPAREQEAGDHKVAIPTLSSGLYTVRLVQNGVAEYRKLFVE